MKAFTFLFLLVCTLEVSSQGWINLNSGTDFPINDIYFVNESTGWFVSHSGLIKKTTDGGQNWTIQTSSSQSELKAIQFVDINNGYIVGGGGTVLKTTNSGVNWIQISTGYTGYFYGIDFISTLIGWIVGSDGKIFKTTDGGLNWTNQSPINNETFFDIDFIDENVGNVVGTGGKIYRSNLGGIDWFPQVSGTIVNGFNAVSLIDAAFGWIGGYYVKKTTNGGTNWVDLPHSFTNDVYFVNRNFGVIAKNNGNVSITSDGGANFFTIPTGTLQDIRCAFFKTENLGWVGGSGGLILKYVDTVANVQLTSPNGGENWVVGSTHNITWTQTGVTNVKLEYTTNNGTSWNQIVSTTPGTTGSYSWTIPNAVSTNCKVRITDVSNGLITDQSDAIFTISVATSAIYLDYPNGGENWVVGNSYSIRWTQTGVTNVKLEFTTNNGTNWNLIVASTPASTGSYSWIIPNTPSTNCRVKITDVSNSSVTDQSNSSFTISGAPSQSVTVISPNGGESWHIGSSHNITWTQNNVANVKIDYSTNNGSSWIQVVASNPASIGSYSWIIPNSVSASCKVKITDVSNSSVSDQSDNTFTISVAPVPSITVFSPNGGENWEVGSSHSITWTQTNVSNVRLDYSTNNGSSWNQVVASIQASTGSYSWTIPNTVSTSCKVRISDVSNSTVSDMSNAVFTISSAPIPAVTITSPNGGEKWFVGAQYCITWNSANIDSLELEYSTNGGTEWILIEASAAANLGSYIWTIPNTPSAECIVRISSTTNSAIFDVSDARFAIAEVPAVTLTSPNGSEKWVAGKQYSITWSAVAVSKLKAEYSADNGTHWIPIADSVAANLGSYIWTVPNTESNNCLVRLTGVDEPTVSDLSDSPFTIELERNLNLTSPTAGETYTSGQTMSIRWTSLNLETVDIYFSADNGAGWQPVADSVNASSQLFEWLIPETNSNQVKVRVVYTQRPNLRSEMAGTITILPSPKVVLQSNLSGAFMKAGSRYNIRWFVENVSAVNILYTSDGGSVWNEIASNIPATVRSYEWVIPALNSAQCRLKIVSADDPTLFSISESQFTIYTYSETVNLSHSWQFGDIKDISNYRLISVPGNISENLGNLMQGKYLNDWNAYWDNGSDANYQIQYDGGDRFNLQPGRGFWVLSKDPVNLTRQIAAASIDSTITTSIPLHTGWNIIGNPFNRDIKWSDVVSRNGLAQNSLIYSWSGAWTFPATMEPFKGYYFLNGDSRANLRLSYPVGQALSKTGIPEMIRLPDRRVRISFGQTEVVAGFSASALTGEDTCDYRLPAVSFSKSDVALVSSNHSDVERHFIVQAQNDDSLGNSFRLKVRNTTERSSELSFDLDKLDAGESVWLIDEKYGEFLDLRVKDKFMIAPQNDALYFTLLIGSESFINSKKQEYLPKEYALYQNYPNPFNPETSIKYALPEDADISIELFDILGNRVQTIYAGAQKAGVHTMQFEPSGLASGVYLYRLVAGKAMLVKKMVLLK